MSNHIKSGGLACRPAVSHGKWKVEWTVWVGGARNSNLRSQRKVNLRPREMVRAHAGLAFAALTGAGAVDA